QNQSTPENHGHDPHSTLGRVAPTRTPGRSSNAPATPAASRSGQNRKKPDAKTAQGSDLPHSRSDSPTGGFLVCLFWLYVGGDTSRNTSTPAGDDCWRGHGPGVGGDLL